MLTARWILDDRFAAFGFAECLRFSGRVFALPDSFVDFGGLLWYNNTTNISQGGDGMPQIIPIRDLKKTAEISQMCKDSGEPIFITKNGYGDMVIMSMELYEQKMFMLDVYSKLVAADEQVKAGKLLDADKGLEDLRKKYNL